MQDLMANGIQGLWENASYDTFLQETMEPEQKQTVGKYMGRSSMKSGIGAYAVQLGEGKVGAVVTLNALW